VPYIVAIIFLILGIRPADADFTTAEVADQHGDRAAAYQACRTDAQAGDAGCQNYSRGGNAPNDATEAAPTAARSWTRRSPDPHEGLDAPRRSVRRSPRGERLSSGGSGFIVSRSGDVLTNYHVVDGCRELHVMQNGEPALATLVAADPTADLAILRLPDRAADAASSSASRCKAC